MPINLRCFPDSCRSFLTNKQPCYNPISLTLWTTTKTHYHLPSRKSLAHNQASAPPAKDPTIAKQLSTTVFHGCTHKHRHTDYSQEVNQHCSAVTARDVNWWPSFFPLFCGVKARVSNSVRQLKKIGHKHMLWSNWEMFNKNLVLLFIVFSRLPLVTDSQV